MPLYPPPAPYDEAIEPLDPRCNDATCAPCGRWDAVFRAVDYAPDRGQEAWSAMVARARELTVARWGSIFSAGAPGSCARRELWHVTECRDVTLVPATPADPTEDPGVNFALARPIAAAGRHVARGPLAGCYVAPGFSRVSLHVPYVRAAGAVPGTVDGAGLLAPPRLHLEWRVGDAGIVARPDGARFTWDPADWRDGQYLSQLRAHLVNRVEVWGWVETLLVSDVPHALPVRIKVNLLIDRHGDGAPGVSYNALANVAADTT
jgi:hypothetical protein